MASGSSIRKSARSERLSGQLGALLVAARGDVSRSLLAQQAGVKPSTLAALERGEANPTLAYLEGIEELYGCTIDLVVRPEVEQPI